MIASESISVLLVDDHPVVRDGFRRLLEQVANIKVVAEAGDGETALERCKEFKPDVVVLDLNMPGIGGLETIRRMKAYDERARILVFSMHSNETMIQRALELGALGYLTKSGDLGQLVLAVQYVAQGKMYIDVEHIKNMAQHKLSDVSADPSRVLSTREFQLFKLLAEGNAVTEIAAMLSISPKTVGVHHTNIMKKLNLHNASQLVLLAVRCNVIEP